MSPSLSPDERARLWAKVATGDPDDCWLWTAATAGGKSLGWYGAFMRSRESVRLDGGPRFVYAHRAVFCDSRGYPLDYLTSDLAMMHTCDNHLCCNPAHLELGTQMDNIRDMIRKNRHRRRQPAQEQEIPV